MNSSAIQPPIQALLTLFEAHLVDVKFPQVDHETLLAAAARVVEAQNLVDDLEQQRQRAAAALVEERAALMATAQLALEYARVYATGNEELRTAVATVQLSARPQRKSRKKRKKTAPESQLTLSKESEMNVKPLAKSEQTAA